MADKNMILSADAEEKLLKPIDEYVGKIQAQIDELRVDGSDKVRSLKNHIAIAKEDKNLSKDEKDSIIAKDKAALEKAKAVEAANKDKVAKLIADAEGYLKEHYDSEYYSKVVASCETEKAAENESYERVKATLISVIDHHATSIEPSVICLGPDVYRVPIDLPCKGRARCCRRVSVSAAPPTLAS